MWLASLAEPVAALGSPPLKAAIRARLAPHADTRADDNTFESPVPPRISRKAIALGVETLPADGVMAHVPNCWSYGSAPSV